MDANRFHISVDIVITIPFLLDDDNSPVSSLPRIMRSLPSAEFLRLVDSTADHQVAAATSGAPMSPLSFDFGRKKRRRQVIID
jgi:hypothetical protein